MLRYGPIDLVVGEVEVSQPGGQHRSRHVEPKLVVDKGENLQRCGGSEEWLGGTTELVVRKVYNFQASPLLDYVGSDFPLATKAGESSMLGGGWRPGGSLNGSL